MDRFKKFEYWEDIAEYDLQTAESMFKTGRYLYVAFMCQQSIEKLIKGLYVLYNNDEPLKIHNIYNIFKKINWLEKPKDFDEKESEYKSLMIKLLSYYIAERYPSYKDKLSQMIDKNEAFSILNHTKEMYIWLKSLKIY